MSFIVTVADFAIGLAIGYVIASFIELILHEYVSDAPTHWVRKWRRYPRLFRVLLNTYFSHHIIHHYQTFRKNHVTQFASPEQRARVDSVLLARGRHGRLIIAGDYANRIHAEGGFVFALPGLVSAVALGFFLPISMAIGSTIALMLPPIFSYWLHPYRHCSLPLWTVRKTPLPSQRSCFVGNTSRRSTATISCITSTVEQATTTWSWALMS